MTPYPATFPGSDLVLRFRPACAGKVMPANPKHCDPQTRRGRVPCTEPTDRASHMARFVTAASVPPARRHRHRALNAVMHCTTASRPPVATSIASGLADDHPVSDGDARGGRARKIGSNNWGSHVADGVPGLVDNQPHRDSDPKG